MTADSQPHWLLARAANFGDDPALVVEGRERSYAELAAAAGEWESVLRQIGAQRGDGVAVVGDWSFQSIALSLALLARGAVWAPIVKTLPPPQIESRLQIAGSDFVARAEEGKIEKRETGEKNALLRRLRESGNAGLILFSSGSAGEPKGMLQDLDAFADAHRDSEKARRGSRYLALLMFDHVGGINTLLASLARGNVLILPQSRRPEEIGRLVEDHRVEVMPLSPSLAALLAMSGELESRDFSSVRLVTYGAEPMPAALLARLREKMPDARFLQTFGASETGIAKTASRDSDSLDFRFVDSGDEYKIVDGELWLRSPRQILGYLNADMSAFTADGWFKTGDLATQTEDGWLRVAGRKSEIINVGGQKVLPQEVERVLMSHPQVADCKAYGEKNAALGQIVAADIAPAADDFDREEMKRDLRRACLRELDRFKVPARFRFVDAIAVSDRLKKSRR